MKENFDKQIPDINKDESIMRVHLKGVLGNLETLQRWGGRQENDSRTEKEIEDDKTQYGKYYNKSFGSPEYAARCENLLTKLRTVFKKDPPDISKQVYDEIFIEWEQLNKEIGK